MANDLPSLSERMAAAARELEGQLDPDATMKIAVELAVSNIGGCEAAGVSIVHARRRIDTPAATDDMAVTGDRLQYELQEGPCLDAVWEQDTIYSPSLAYDQRWPRWGPRVVAETGAQSVLSFQLFTHEDTLGALNLYSRVKDGFSEEDRQDGLALAAHIAIAVAAAQQISHLTKAMDTRSVIGQALGILMERFDLDAPRAFAVLTRIAQTEQQKLQLVAAELVETRRIPWSRPGE
jgi:GAF domain-containing protein